MCGQCKNMHVHRGHRLWSGLLLDDVDRVQARGFALKEVTEATHEQQARGSLGQGDAALYAVAVQHIQDSIPVRCESHALLSKRHCCEEDSLHISACSLLLCPVYGQLTAR